jgi:hypothetical protein
MGVLLKQNILQLGQEHTIAPKNSIDCLFQLVAGHWFEIQLRLAGLGKKFLVLQGFIEGFTKNLFLLLSCTRRQNKGTGKGAVTVNAAAICTPAALYLGKRSVIFAHFHKGQIINVTFYSGTVGKFDKVLLIDGRSIRRTDLCVKVIWNEPGYSSTPETVPTDRNAIFSGGFQRADHAYYSPYLSIIREKNRHGGGSRPFYFLDIQTANLYNQPLKNSYILKIY